MALRTRDLGHAVRTLCKSPVFTAVAVLVLGLAIGANLTAFTWVNVLFFRPLPVDRPDELVQIWSTDAAGAQLTTFTKAVEVLRTEPMFRGTCAFQEIASSAEIGGLLRTVSGEAMSWDCFQALGLRAQLGRAYTEAEDLRTDDRVVVLSDSVWRRDFAADPGVLGREVRYGGARYTVIGVLEPRFTGLNPGSAIEVVVPLSQVPVFPEIAVRGKVHVWGHFLVRRAPGVTLAQVRSRLPALGARMLDDGSPSFFTPRQRSDYTARKVVAAPASSAVDREWLGRRFGAPLYAFLGLSLLVLAVACVSVAALMLARGATRTKEMLIRLALGGSRFANFRLLALEGVLLVLGGAAVGAGLARLANGLVAARAGETFRRTFDPALDLRAAFVLAMLVAAVSAMLSFAVASQVRRLGHAGLSQNQRGTGLFGARSQRLFVGAQVALTLALVCVGGLLTASVRNLYRLDFGIRTNDLSFALLRTDPAAGGGALDSAYFAALRQRILEVPGVTGAAFSGVAPFWSGTYNERATLLDSAAPDLDAAAVVVDEEALALMGVQVAAGDGFRGFAGASPEPTAIVTRSLADRWGGDAAIGEHLRIGDSRATQRLRIVGISANARFGFGTREQAPPMVFVNFWEQSARDTSYLLVSAATGGRLDEKAIVAAVRSLGRQYAGELRTVTRAKNDALIENTALALVSGSFGVFALALAAAGLFGLLSYQVATRAAEIGVRMALGARPCDVSWLVTRETLPVVAVGIAVGLGLTFALGKTLSGVAFGIAAHDPRLLVTSVLVILATAVLAAWAPARRAALLDPVEALRRE